MEKKTQGAWVVHHANKLNQITASPPEFQEISFAGRCGVLLSSVGSSDEGEIPQSRFEALAKAAGINARLELPSIVGELERQKLLSRTAGGIHVLGVSTASVLEHTATIFEEAEPSSSAKAALEISERASELPLDGALALQYISDTYKIPSKECQALFDASTTIGFVDSEKVKGGSQILFNGNLFRRNDAQKMKAVADSLQGPDLTKFRQANSQLMAQGCMSLEELTLILSENLFKKLHSIGAYDVNTVANDTGSYSYVTRPAAFSKFAGGSIADDAFDLAKAFVTSLTFGMTRSGSGRGRITMINALMQKLINGYWVGPATAIGQDYKVLELRGVISLRTEKSGMYSMRLLKRDVGELALKVINEGDVSAESLVSLPGASVTKYTPPEHSRVIARRDKSAPLQHSVGALLDSLRQGKV